MQAAQNIHWICHPADVWNTLSTKYVLTLIISAWLWFASKRKNRRQTPAVQFKEKQCLY